MYNAIHIIHIYIYIQRERERDNTLVLLYAVFMCCVCFFVFQVVCVISMCWKRPQSSLATGDRWVADKLGQH